MKYLFFLLCCLSAFCSSGQDTIYYDADWKTVPTLDSASCYKIVSPDTNGSGGAVAITYYKSGGIEEEAYYSDYKERKMHGICREYYKNGFLRREIHFNNGKYDGDIITFWENAIPRRRDIYKEGTLVAGRCFSVSGKDTAYYDFIRKPEYPGGLDSLSAFLKRELVYPRKAKRKGIQGRVMVVFAVNKDGTISDIRVAESVYEDLDNEAVRVAKLMPPWKPGIIEGSPVRFSFNLPVRFRLE
jgi:protein TonB